MTWTVRDAKARLSEVMRAADTEGPQRIGVTARQYVLVAAAEWERASASLGQHMGRWLVENMPRGEELVLPSREEPPRAVPFVDS